MQKIEIEAWKFRSEVVYLKFMVGDPVSCSGASPRLNKLNDLLSRQHTPTETPKYQFLLSFTLVDVQCSYSFDGSLSRDKNRRDKQGLGVSSEIKIHSKKASYLWMRRTDPVGNKEALKSSEADLTLHWLGVAGGDIEGPSQATPRPSLYTSQLDSNTRLHFSSLRQKL